MVTCFGSEDQHPSKWPASQMASSSVGESPSRVLRGADFSLNARANACQWCLPPTCLPYLAPASARPHKDYSLNHGALRHQACQGTHRCIPQGLPTICFPPSGPLASSGCAHCMQTLARPEQKLNSSAARGLGTDTTSALVMAFCRRSQHLSSALGNKFLPIECELVVDEPTLPRDVTRSQCRDDNALRQFIL